MPRYQCDYPRRLQNGYQSLWNGSNRYSCLLYTSIDKARSIAVLSEKLGITREEVAAMGDGYNDLSMIKYAGLGIAMNNAQEPVKAAADYIAPSNDEDGVAIAVERYFLHAF